MFCLQIPLKVFHYFLYNRQQYFVCVAGWFHIPSMGWYILNVQKVEHFPLCDMVWYIGDWSAAEADYFIGITNDTLG